MGLLEARAVSQLIESAARVQADWIASVARATGGRVWDEDGIPCAARPGELLIPFPSRLPDDPLDRVVAWATEQRVPTVGCWTAGDAPAIGSAVEARGFEEGWRHHWMATRTGPAPADARVAPAREVPEWDDFGQALLTMASERTVPLVARVDGELAGFAWLHAPVAEPVAGIFDVVVFPAFRRRGLGRALTAAACARAAELGLDQVTLNATGEGELLYRALGFRSLGHGRTWWLHLARA